MQSKLTYRESGRSLVQLQQLEASGSLPLTSDVTNGFVTHIGFRKCIARNIAIGIAHSKQPLEIIQWLRDGGHLIDYGMICITAAKNENINLLQKLYDGGDDPPPYLCPLYLLNWFGGQRSSKITDEVRQWLVDCKKNLDDQNAYFTDKYSTYNEGNPDWKRQSAAALEIINKINDDMNLSPDQQWYEDIGYYYNRYSGVTFHD